MRVKIKTECISNDHWLYQNPDTNSLPDCFTVSMPGAQLMGLIRRLVFVLHHRMNNIKKKVKMISNFFVTLC